MVPPPGALPLVDLDALFQLRELLEAGFEEAVERYIGESAARLAALEKAAASGDTRLVRDQARALREASRPVGAAAVAALAKTLERAAEAGVEELPLLVERLAGEFRATVRVLESAVG
jgi:HPt (histidine-containing phosphotransfer) domain-containing protein